MNNVKIGWGFQELLKEWRTNQEVLQPMVERMRSNRSEWCRQLMAPPYCFTEEQVVHIAQRYQLGISRHGDTVFWLIDQNGIAKDAMVGDTWASQLLKKQHVLDEEWHPCHCLFGMHLRGHDIDMSGNAPTIALTESVKSCAILSELYPQYIWMATGFPLNANIDTMIPLMGRKVICFPNTDPTSSNYVFWLDLAKEAKEHRIECTVSPILEQRATEEQKERKIDLVEFLFENKN